MKPDTREDASRALGKTIRRRARALGRASIRCVPAILVASVPLGMMLTQSTQVARAAAMTAVSAARPAASSGSSGLAVLDVVMLMDESGSETSQELAVERESAAEITQSLLNPASRVTVIGFGGVNHVAPNQVATDVACVPTIASGAANLAYLSTCVNNLHVRTEAEGNETDYAAALGQALSYLSPSSTATPPSPRGAIKLILMMTGGAVDVHGDTQQYGTDWQLGEQTAISQQLRAAASDGVQVWPLGAGTDIGAGVTELQALAYLNFMAAGGAQSACGKIQPHAAWVNNPGDTMNAFEQLFTDAACLGINSSQGQVSGAESTTLTMSIPDVASAAAISVDRASPLVSVVFTQPTGDQWTDASVISGQDSPVEVLHLNNITSADVGTWRINLTALRGTGNTAVSVTPSWQGAIRALITANPPNAKPGQPINVTIDVLGPNGPITDPATLKDLVVGVTATGAGLSGTVNVPISAVSGAPGEYKGTFLAPNQPTTLTFTGSAAGYGLYATEIPATVGVGTQAQGFSATPEFTGETNVSVGGTITGQVFFSNQTGSARRVRLEVQVSGAVAALTSPTSPVTVPAGSRPNVPFTIAIARDSPAGLALVQVRALDAATGQALNVADQDFTVTKPPGFLASHWWVIVALLALIILAILAAFRRAVTIRRRLDVRGLVAVLRRDSEELDTLKASDQWSMAFQFVIRDAEADTPRLDYAVPGSSAFTVKRARHGEVSLTTPTGESREVIIGGHGREVGQRGLILSFRDSHSLARANGTDAQPGGAFSDPRQ